MKVFIIIFILTNIFSSSIADGDDENANYEVTNRTFPKGFVFGVATAAYQIEGGWNEDGKGEQIWDTWIHKNPEKIPDRANGDIATDSYHKYKEDVACMKAVGVDYYRLSISWSRILPNGRISKINLPGVNYYINVFKELKANNIKIMVTLHHWDMPTALQDIGGWNSPEIVDLFGDYARLCYQLFGEYVDTWITINEPRQICNLGFGSGAFPPGIVSPGVDEYICSRYILLAHARAWHIFNDEFRSKYNARATIVIDSYWYEPTTDSDEDKAAAETRLQVIFGMYANPIYKKNWPQVMIDRVAERSKLEGYNQSRLPAFSDEEIEYISGTYDFMGINHYTTHMVSAASEPEIGTPDLGKDAGGYVYQKDTWQQAAGSWFRIVPWGIGKLMRWLKATYGNLEIVITENGLSDTTGTLEDDDRINYLKHYMSHLLDAMYDAEVNVTGYTVWSIIDNFEWTQGYNAKFGLYYVNMTDPERTRIPKKSSKYYADVIESRCLLDKC